MADRAPNEVWIQYVSKNSCYVRIGEKDNLATVNFNGGSFEAEIVRKAFDELFASRANTNELSTQDQTGE